jgi:hypothetical protein
MCAQAGNPMLEILLKRFAYDRTSNSFLARLIYIWYSVGMYKVPRPIEKLRLMSCVYGCYC